jgi:hypothetical protein
MRRSLIASHYGHLLEEREREDVLCNVALKRLALGQFELAVAALRPLATQHAGRVRALLLDIVENGAASDWLNAAAPVAHTDAHLRWLALVALRRLGVDAADSGLVPARLQRQIEFDVLLHASPVSAPVAAELLAHLVDLERRSADSSLAGALLADYVRDDVAPTAPLSSSATQYMRRLLVDAPALAEALRFYVGASCRSAWRATALALAREALDGANVPVLVCALRFLAAQPDADADAVLRDAVLLCAEGPLARSGDAVLPMQLDRWRDVGDAAKLPRRTRWRSDADALQARVAVQQALLTGDSIDLSLRFAAFQKLYARSLHDQQLTHGASPSLHYPLQVLLSADEAPTRSTLLRLFWIDLHSTATANDAHALELLLSEFVRLVRGGRLVDASRLLGPVPQLRPLAVLLAWDAADESAVQQRALIDALCAPGWYERVGAPSPLHAAAVKLAVELSRRTRVAHWAAAAVFPIVAAQSAPSGAAQTYTVRLGADHTVSARDADALFAHLMVLAHDESLVSLLRDFWARLDRAAALAVVCSADDDTAEAQRDASLLRALFAVRLVHDALLRPTGAGALDAAFDEATRLLSAIESTAWRREPLLVLERFLLATASPTAPSKVPQSWLTAHFAAWPLELDANRPAAARPVANRLVRLLATCTSAGGGDAEWAALKQRAQEMLWRLTLVEQCGELSAPHVTAPRALFGDQRPAQNEFDEAQLDVASNLGALLLASPASLVGALLRAGALDVARTAIDRYGADVAPLAAQLRQSSECAALRAFAAQPDTNAAAFTARIQLCVDALSGDSEDSGLLATEVCIDAAMCAPTRELSAAALGMAKAPLSRAASASPASPHVQALARLLNRLNDVVARATTDEALAPLLLDLRAHERRVSTAAPSTAAAALLRSAPALAATRAADDSLARLQAAMSAACADAPSSSEQQGAALVDVARAFEALNDCDDEADSNLLTAFLARTVRHVLYVGDNVHVDATQRRYFALLMRSPAELLERVLFVDKAFDRAATVAGAIGVDLTRVALERLSINRQAKRLAIGSAYDAAAHHDADDAEAPAAAAAAAPSPASASVAMPSAQVAGVSAQDVAQFERERDASAAFALSDELASVIARRSPLLATLVCLLRAPLSHVDHALAVRALRGVMSRDEFAAFRRWVMRRTLAYDAFVRIFGDGAADDALVDGADGSDEPRLLARLQSLAASSVRVSDALADESSAAAHAFALLQQSGDASDVDDFYEAAAEHLVLNGDASRALRLLEQRLVTAAAPDIVILVRLKRLGDAELSESWRLVRRVRDARYAVPYVVRHVEQWPLVPALQTVAIVRDRADAERAAELGVLLATLQLVEALVRAAERANVKRFSVLAAVRPTPAENDWCTLFAQSRSDPSALVRLALRCDAFALARQLYTELLLASPELQFAVERGHVRHLLENSRQAEALDVVLAVPRDKALVLLNSLLGDVAWLQDGAGDTVLQLQAELFLTRLLIAAGSPGGGHLFVAADDHDSDFDLTESDDDDDADDGNADDGAAVAVSSATRGAPAPDSLALPDDQLSMLTRRAHGLAALLCLTPQLAAEHRGLASRPLLLIECLLMLARTDAVAAILAGVPELQCADTDSLAVAYMRRSLRYDADSATTRARARHVALTVAARRPMRAVGGTRTLLIDDYDADVAHCLRGVLRATEWRLTGDAAADDGTRTRHFFAAAPSLSLARRLLALASDKIAAARACVDAAEYLSGQLLRLPSPAVDAGEGADIVALMQRVLRHGKSLFVAASMRRADGDESESRLSAAAEGVALCDSLISHTELLGQLHAAKCVPVEMSLKDFRNEARTRALRDALIASDDVELALEVATKCRLSSEPVFIAWGVALLELGEYAAARDKFSRCMTRPNDRPASFAPLDAVADERIAAAAAAAAAAPKSSSPQQASSPSPVPSPSPSPAPSSGALIRSRGSQVAASGSETLNKIINVLDLRPSPPTIASLRQQQRELRDYLSDKGATNHFEQMSVDAFLGAMHLPDAATESEAPVDASSIALARLNECVFYVTQYGSCARALEFLSARSLHKELVAFVLRAAVSPALFVEHAVLPALARVQLQSLLESMREFDASLVSFSDYLLAVCKYFNHRRAWQLLLDVQVFMGDAARAALTCVKVFLTAQTEDERLQWLERAKSQLEHALAPEGLAAAASMATAVAARATASAASAAASSPGSPGSSSPPTSSPPPPNSTIAGTAPILSDAELARYLRSVQLQIDVVRFLHAPVRRKLVSDEERALSLFGSGRQKAALCEQLLVLGNFDLAFAIMQDFRLPVVRVYINAIERLARSNLVGRVNDLLKDIRLMGIDERQFGEVVMSAIELYAGALQRADMAEKFIDKLTEPRHVVRAHALVGNFKQAYIGAARLESVDEVYMVRTMASDAGAGAVVAMCDKFLVAKGQQDSSSQV